MTPQNPQALTPEERDAEFQRQEAIRIANSESTGEATPPDISPQPTRSTGSPTSDENFDGTTPGGAPGKSLEDRDTNDGDANNEN